MLKTNLKSSITIVIKLLLIIALLGVAAIFVEKCISKFIEKSTTFKITSAKRIIVENPTMVICFGPGYKKLNWTGFDLNNINETIQEYWVKNSVYRMGQDFDVTVCNEIQCEISIINKEGTITIFRYDQYSYSLEVKSIITMDLGLCYEFVSKSNFQGYLSLQFTLRLNPLLESKPHNLMIVFTSEQNSIGIAYNAWYEGKEMIVDAGIGVQHKQKINLKRKKIEYLPETSGCIKNSTTYNCVAQNFYQSNYNEHCERPCVPYTWQQILNHGISNTLPICLTEQEAECMFPLIFESCLSSFQDCPSSCDRYEYYGGVYKAYATGDETFSANEAKWTLAFSSRRTVTEKESLTFDTIDMIIYVGGAFGLALGFSFYDSLMKLINNVFHTKL